MIKILLLVGTLYGLGFGFMALLEFGWKEAIAWFFGCIIGTFLIAGIIAGIATLIFSLPI